jgi:ketosteroid isomerase-like protein
VRKVALWIVVAVAVAAAILVVRVVKQSQAPAIPVTAASALHELVAAERAFAATSLNRGYRDAFLEWLADDGVLFRPLPRNGKEVFSAAPPNPATLAWQPAFAEVSADGDLGYTYGPWEFRPPPDSTGAPPDSTSIAHGTFVTVWQRQPDRAWRVAVDIGATHARPESGGLGSDTLSIGPDHAWAMKTAGGRPATDLAAIDEAYERDAVRDGAGALATWGAGDLHFLTEGQRPVAGNPQTREALSSRGAIVDFHTQGVRISESDDLGCTYGILERARASVFPRPAAVDTSVFVHVWRREQDTVWRLALIVENPIHPPR